MSDAISERAPAKVNLALHVLGRRADGYHELDSLVVFVPQVADEVVVRRAPSFSLHVHGPFAGAVPQDERNLALRAALALARRWPRHVAPVQVRLRKNLPAAAGIGGGSADAAAVLRAMCRLFAFTPPAGELEELARELGADVPVCLRARAARMRGSGERITPLALPGGVHLLLVNPGVEVSTAQVFAALRAGAVDASRALPLAADAGEWRDAGRLAAVLAMLRNDLQPPACRLVPAVGACLQWLHQRGDALLVRMSGSGATCFALYRDAAAARAALLALRQERPQWWAQAGSAQ